MNRKNIVLIVISLILAMFLSGCSNLDSLSENLNLENLNAQNSSIKEKVTDIKENLSKVKNDIIENKDNLTMGEIKEIVLNETQNTISEITELKNETTNIIANNLSEIESSIENTSQNSISVNENNQIVVERNSNATFDESLSIEEWCLEGESFNFETSEGDVSSVIVGSEIFKDSEYCKATGETIISDMTIPSVYYFNNGATDVWVVLELFGETIEQNIVLN